MTNYEIIKARSEDFGVKILVPEHRKEQFLKDVKMMCVGLLLFLMFSSINYLFCPASNGKKVNYLK